MNIIKNASQLRGRLHRRGCSNFRPIRSDEPKLHMKEIIGDIKASLNKGCEEDEAPLAHYRDLGKKLVTLKDSCTLGEFGTCCADELHLNHTSANQYMAVYRGWLKIQARLRTIRETTGINKSHRTLKFGLSVLGDEKISVTGKGAPDAPRHPPMSDLERFEVKELRVRPEPETVVRFHRLIERFRQHPSSRMAEEIAAIAHDHGWLLRDFAVAAHVDPRLISQLVAQYSAATTPRRLQSSH